MGLIKAGIGAVGGTLADQWKEFFYCDSLDKEVLVVKGQKRTSSRSSNTKGNDNIISNGSGIAVADGQCMIIVEQGKIVEVCAEPGEFTYDTSTVAYGFISSEGPPCPEERTFLVIVKQPVDCRFVQVITDVFRTRGGIADMRCFGKKDSVIHSALCQRARNIRVFCMVEIVIEISLLALAELPIDKDGRLIGGS